MSISSEHSPYSETVQLSDSVLAAQADAFEDAAQLNLSAPDSRDPRLVASLVVTSHNVSEMAAAANLQLILNKSKETV